MDAGRYWPSKAAAVVAVLLGLLLMAMGGGHISGVLAVAEAQDKPADYRLVSLVATGAILAFPGLIGVLVSPWLWKGKGWAYAVSILSASAVMAYLVFLVLLVAPNSTTVGSELNYAVLFVGIFLVVLAVAWLMMARRRRRSSYGGLR